MTFEQRLAKRLGEAISVAGVDIDLPLEPDLFGRQPTHFGISLTKLPDADHARFSRVLFMLADIRFRYMNTKDEKEKLKLAQKAVSIINAAHEDKILDQRTSLNWLQQSLPGTKFTITQDDLPDYDSWS